MNSIIQAIIGGLLSGSVISAVIGYVLHRRQKTVEADINRQLQEGIARFHSTLEWKERSLAELLGPIYVQLDRTKRAHERHEEGRAALPERQALREGNRTIQQLLLKKGHLIPPLLFVDAGALLEHYDRWTAEHPVDRKTGIPMKVEGVEFPFPVDAADRFRETFRSMWNEPYSTG